MRHRQVIFVACAIFAFTLRAETLVLVAGGGNGPDGGPAIGAKINHPFAASIDKAGNLYTPEFSGNCVRKIDPKGIITTIAGTGAKAYSGDGGPALKSEMNWMHHLIVGPDGNLYVADTGNSCVRKIDLTTGIITTVAGTGKKGFSGDGGPAVKAEFGNIYCISFDAKGERMYLLDLDNRRVRVVDMKSGVVTTFAGNGQKGVPKNGADAATAPLVDPRAVAADANGNVYILERSGNALRVVDASGKIKTVAGTGKKGFSGDGGDALKAEFAGPKHIFADHDGSVLIADSDNHVVRRYSPKDGKITRVAGSGKMGTEGLNGPPENAQLNQPHGVYVDAGGTIYICDSMNDRILKIVK
ncbi:MAG TPA: hypothetical protein VKX17_21735 [Planctomycetota bacterium]|nr:hypothetical protein [Planctomycetota bacterium]